MSIHLVYVTGTYSRETSAGRAKNIDAAKSAAWEIVGFLPDWYPVTPHTEGAVRVRHFATLPVDNLLPKCDALLVVGSSCPLHLGGKTVPASGYTKQEIDTAVSLGIPVFYNIEDFKAAVLFDARTESNPKGEAGMKTIKYMGREYEVPDWAEFISTDEDGEVYVFEFRPEADEDGCVGFWYKNDFQPKGRLQLVDQNGWSWLNSLVKIGGDDNHENR